MPRGCAGSPPSAVPALALLAQSLIAARNREFRFLWLANTLNSFARWFEIAVLSWLVLDLTGSPWEVAVVGFWRYVPLLPIGPVGGFLADRVDRRRLVSLTQLASAGIVLAVAVLLLGGQITLWHLVVSSACLGLLVAVDFPCRRALVPDVVARREMVNATALESASDTLSRILGPLLGGAFIVLLGVGGCYVVLALAYVAAGLAVLGLSPVPPTRQTSVRRGLESLLESVRYARRRPDISVALSAALLANFLAFPCLQLMPVFARDNLQLDPARYGTLGASIGLGALVSSLAMAAQAQRWRPEPTYLVGNALMGLGLVPFALTTSYAVAVLSLSVVGFGLGLYASLYATVILLRAEVELRGRLMGLLVVAVGIWPVGVLVLGALTQSLGAPLALSASAIVFLLALAALAARYRTFYQP